MAPVLSRWRGLCRLWRSGRRSVRASRSNPLRPERTGTAWWAVDKVVVPYYCAAVAALAAYFPAIEGAWWLIAAHVAAIAVLWVEVKRPNAWSWGFRHWYALPYVAACYKVMAVLIPAIRTTDADQWLADLDFRLWGAHPTVWLERISSPVLTEAVQICYSLFIPAVLLIPFLIWRRRRYADFRYYAYLIALGFLVSYVGYLLVPARGPRFLLRGEQTIPLAGMWFFDFLQQFLDRLESAHYDCFPSGHTELTMIAWWGSRLISKRLFLVYSAYTVSIVFATVYLRYHYTVDVLAGILTAAALIAAGPVLYRRLSPKDSAFGAR
jgi:membrane-associated phospholipid phosphatase